MDTIASSDIAFIITKEDVQLEAMEKIGRLLTDEEMYIAKKGLQSGLMTSIDIVYHTIFQELIGDGRN